MKKPFIKHAQNYIQQRRETLKCIITVIRIGFISINISKGKERRKNKFALPSLFYLAIKFSSHSLKTILLYNG